MGGDRFQMSRFFVNSSAVNRENGTIAITGEDVKHIKNVLRGAVGDKLEICDQEGTDYKAAIEVLEKDSVIAEIISSKPNKTEPPVNITLYQGLPKSDKMEYIIQKCIELGVFRIVPVMTERTVVRFGNDKDAAAKASRWQKIAQEAAKQCDRGIIPKVETPVIPYEEETDGSLRSLLNSFSQKYDRGDDMAKPEISLFIGPEGGFAQDEVKEAEEAGFASVTLGPRILRTETAGVAVIAIIMYELGDMSPK
jgi:16S rRNA (uracil1498-N3)-methyltransferase